MHGNKNQHTTAPPAPLTREKADSPKKNGKKKKLTCSTIDFVLWLGSQEGGGLGPVYGQMQLLRGSNSSYFTVVKSLFFVDVYTQRRLQSEILLAVRTGIGCHCTALPRPLRVSDSTLAQRHGNFFERRGELDFNPPRIQTLTFLCAAVVDVAISRGVNTHHSLFYERRRAHKTQTINSNPLEHAMKRNHWRASAVRSRTTRISTINALKI